MPCLAHSLSFFHGQNHNKIRQIKPKCQFQLSYYSFGGMLLKAGLRSQEPQRPYRFLIDCSFKGQLAKMGRRVGGSQPRLKTGAGCGLGLLVDHFSTLACVLHIKLVGHPLPWSKC
jgi:hypothetical protein